MAAQKQEVELLIKAGTEGLRSIAQLVKELEALGEDTGEASAKLEGLAGSLAELKNQQGLVKQFSDLKSQTRQLAQQQAEAKGQATALGKALAATEQPTKAQRKEFEQARKAAKAADQAWLANQKSLNELRGTLQDAGVSTKDLASEQVRIRKALDGVNGETSDLTNELRQMRDGARDAAKGTDSAAKSAKKLGDEASQSTGLLKKLGSGLKFVAKGATAVIAGVGASVATMSLFSRSQATVADDLTNTANAINENREALQVWQVAGERVGLTGEKVSDILRSVTERLGEFSATGGGEAADVMERLNLRIQDFEGLRPSESLLKFAGAIESLPKPEQVALLEKLGSDASQLQPLLENNAAGLRAIAAEARQSGSIYSEQELDKLLRANDIYNSLSIKIQGLTRRIGAELAPVVADATNKVIDLFDQNDGAKRLADLFRRITELAADATASLVRKSGAITDAIAGTFSVIKSAVQVVYNYSDAILAAAQAWVVYKGAQAAVGLAQFATMIRTKAVVAMQDMSAATKGATGRVSKFGAALGALKGPAQVLALAAVFWGVDKASEAAGAAIADYVRRHSEGARVLAENEQKVAGIARERIEALKAEAEQLEQYRQARRVGSEEAIRLSESERSAVEARLQKQIELFENEKRQLEYFAILGHDVGAQMADIQSAIDGANESLSNLGNASEVSAKALESGISAEAQQLVDKFRAMVSSGGDAADAIEGLFAGFDASDVSSVRTLVEAVGAISEKSVEAGLAIEKELRDRLDSMTSEELQRFAITLQGAFDDGADSASRFGMVAEEVADAALRRIGTSFEELRTGISDAERDALTSFQTFTQTGARSVDDVRKVIGELKDDIRSSEAVDALRQLLESWASESGVRIDQVKEQLTELAEGVKGTAAQVGAELLAAIDSAGDQETLDELKGRIGEVWSEGAIGQERYAELMNQVRERQRALADESTESGDRIKGAMDKAADSAKGVGNAAKDAADKAGQAGEIVLSTGSFLAQFFNNTTQRLLRLGEKVHDQFVTAMGMEAPAREVEGLRERIESLNGEIARIRHIVPGFNVFTGWLQEVSINAKAAERDFLLQKVAVAELLDEFERGDYSAGILNDSVDELENRFDLLSDQDLAPLRSAIERIQGEVESLNTSLADTIASLRQELAGLQGDTIELEGLRYQEQRAEMEERLQRARELGDQEAIAAAQEALALQEEAYRLRLADAKAQKEADRERASREAAEEERRRQEEERQQRQRDDAEYAREERQSRQQIETVRTINVNLNGETFRLLEDDEDAFVRALEQARGTFQ